MLFNFIGARAFKIIVMTMLAPKPTDANYANIGGCCVKTRFDPLPPLGVEFNSSTNSETFVRVHSTTS